MTAMAARAAWVATAVFMAGTWAHAANLTLDAPQACVDPTTLAQEVADLAGRPLADVPDVDFRLTIRPAAGGRWRSTLEAVEHRPGVPEARHLRELEARSCADLGEAAALAMSVSIRAVAEAAAPPPGSRTPPPPEVVEAPARIVQSVPPPAAPPGWRGLIAAALAADTGELPGAGLGVGVSLGVARGTARLNAFGGWLPPRDDVRSNGAGGSFQLAFGGAEGCFAPSRGRWTALGCAGGEVGRQSGSSIGAADPGSGHTLWRAARATLGLVYRASELVGFVVTATAVVPLARAQFVLDQNTVVYRAAAIAGRLAAGVELTF